MRQVKILIVFLFILGTQHLCASDCFENTSLSNILTELRKPDCDDGEKADDIVRKHSLFLLELTYFIKIKQPSVIRKINFDLVKQLIVQYKAIRYARPMESVDLPKETKIMLDLQAESAYYKGLNRPGDFLL